MLDAGSIGEILRWKGFEVRVGGGNRALVVGLPDYEKKAIVFAIDGKIVVSKICNTTEAILNNPHFTAIAVKFSGNKKDVMACVDPENPRFGDRYIERIITRVMKILDHD